MDSHSSYQKVLTVTGNDHRKRLSSPDSSSLRPGRHTPWTLYVAIAVCLTLAALTILFTLHQVEITGLNGSSRTLYVVFVTAGATAVTFFITNRIQTQWFQKIDTALVRCEDIKNIAGLDNLWRTNVGVAGLKQRLAHRSTWLNQLSYWIAALITTAIVAATTPSTSTREGTYETFVPSGDHDPCASYVDNEPSQYAWHTPNGTFFATWHVPYCPTAATLSLIPGINVDSPEAYAYEDHGVAVQRSAIGAHLSIYSQALEVPGEKHAKRTGLQLEMSGDNRDSLLQVSQCVPIMTSNPVSCRAAGTLDLGSSDDESTSVSASSDNCTATNPGNGKQSLDTISVADICMDKNPIGVATVVLGSTSYSAARLAVAMNDTDWLNSHWKSDNLTLNDTYVATCHVDIMPTLQWRMVTLSLQTDYSAEVPYRQILSADTETTCDPGKNVTLGLAYAATAAMGLAFPLWQNWGWNGDATAIMGKATNYSGPSLASGVKWNQSNFRSTGWAFNNSRSGLEDTLGLITGLSLSRLLTADPATGSQVPEINVQGKKVSSIYRVGTGRLYILICALPPLVTAVFALWLALSTSYTTTQYTSSKMASLVQLGMDLQEDRLLR